MQGLHSGCNIVVVCQTCILAGADSLLQVEQQTQQCKLKQVDLVMATGKQYLAPTGLPDGTPEPSRHFPAQSTAGPRPKTHSAHELEPARWTA